MKSCNLCCCRLSVLLALSKYCESHLGSTTNREVSRKVIFTISFTTLPLNLPQQNCSVPTRMGLVAAPWSSCMNLAVRQRVSNRCMVHWPWLSYTGNPLTRDQFLKHSVRLPQRNRLARKEKQQHTKVIHLAGCPGLFRDVPHYEQQQSSELNYTPVVGSFESSLFLLAKQEVSEVQLHLAKANFADTCSDFHYKGNRGSLTQHMRPRWSENTDFNLGQISLQSSEGRKQEVQPISEKPSPDDCQTKGVVHMQQLHNQCPWSVSKQLQFAGKSSLMLHESNEGNGP